MKSIQQHDWEEKGNKEIVNYLVEASLRQRYEKLHPRNSYTFQGNRYRQTILSIAAIFLIVVSAVFIRHNLQSNNLNELADTYIKETTILGNQNTMRKDLSTNDELRIQANTYFVEEKFNLTIKTYLALQKKSPLTSTDKFYLATAYIKNDDNDAVEALKYFNQIEKDSPFQTEILWLSSLCYLKTGDYKQAKIRLNDLQSKTSYKTKEVTEILNRIGNKN